MFQSAQGQTRSSHVAVHLIHLVKMTNLDVHYTTIDPAFTGLLFTCKCQHAACSMYNVQVYAFIGSEGCFSFKTEADKCICSRCHHKVGPIEGVTLNNCQWSYKGELNSGGIRESAPKVTTSYYHLLEIEPFSWSWLQISIHSLDGETPAPRKRSRQSESESEDSTAVREEMRVSAIEPRQSMLKLQPPGFPSLDAIREDVQRKQEIIDILKAETKHKEKEKRTLEEKVRKMREEVRVTQVERLKKSKASST